MFASSAEAALLEYVITGGSEEYRGDTIMQLAQNRNQWSGGELLPELALFVIRFLLFKFIQ
jgi:hypothetical protein